MVNASPAVTSDDTQAMVITSINMLTLQFPSENQFANRIESISISLHQLPTDIPPHGGVEGFQ